MNQPCARCGKKTCTLTNFGKETFCSSCMYVGPNPDKPEQTLEKCDICKVGFMCKAGNILFCSHCSAEQFLIGGSFF